jgi:hypothetical protein
VTKLKVLQAFQKIASQNILDEKKFINCNASSCYSPNKLLKRALREQRYLEVPHHDSSLAIEAQRPHLLLLLIMIVIHIECFQIVCKAGAVFTKNILHTDEGTFETNERAVCVGT